MKNHYIPLFVFLFFSFFFINGQTFSGTSFSLSHQFNGNYGFTEIGNTLSYTENNSGNTPTCSLKTSSSAILNLGPNQTVQAAYLYWSGPGNPNGHTTVLLNGNSVTSSSTSIATFSATVPHLFQIFGCIADVTSLVQTTSSGNYVFSGLNLNNTINPNGNGSNYCTNGLDYAGWAILIIYQDLSLPPNQVNIYNGFKVIHGNFINQITISLTNLNVTNPIGSKLGFLAWNGTSYLNFQESVKFNNNVLSNPPLNPADNPFNSTNSYTGSNTLWNMDLDYFDTSSYLNVGDTQASIEINSFVNPVALHHVVTAIPSELPDAALEIDSAVFSPPCQNNSLDVAVTLSNTNATAVLPANVPISFFLDDPAGNPVYSVTTNSSQPLPIGASLPINLSIPVPAGVSGTTMLTATANLDQSGQHPIHENNLLNNSDSLSITLPDPPPPPFQPQDLSKCGELGTTGFDLWDAMAGVDTTGLQTAFFKTQNEAQNNQNPIGLPGNFSPAGATQIIFVRLTDNAGCFALGSFVVELWALPTVNRPVPFVQCESGPPLGIEQFDIHSKINEITGGNSSYTIGFYLTQPLAENGDPNDALSSPFTNTQANIQTIYARVETPEGCFKIVPLELEVGNLEPARDSVVFDDCGENGTADFNLIELTPEILTILQLQGLNLLFFETQTHAENGSPEIDDPANYPVTGNATLWIRAENAEGCFALAKLILEVGETPVIENPLQDLVACVEGETPVFDLTKQNETIDPHGLYEMNYYVSQSDFQNQNPIDEPASFSPTTLPKSIFVTLTNPETGCTSDLASFELREPDGCGEVLSLDYPAFFTPNGDGKNERWNIHSLSNPSGVVIHIFDRFGKLLFSIEPGRSGWNGTYNGKRMPSGEYWFKVNYPDSNNRMKTLMGHFSLIR